MVLGEALRKSGELDEAIKAFERAAALAPMATGEDAPNAQIAEVALQKKDTARRDRGARSSARRGFRQHRRGPPAGGADEGAGVTDPAKLRPVYQRIVAIDPFDAEAHTMLGRLSMQMNQPDVAVRSFKTVVALKPVDPALAYTDLAESYFRSGKRVEARRQTLAALEVAPSYERAQDLLLKIAEGRP